MSNSVLEIAQQFLKKVKKSGPDNIMALCPFHDNRDTPSFTMSLSKGLFYCFSCHERGSLVTFLRAIGVNRAGIEGRYKYVLEELQRSIPTHTRSVLLPPLTPNTFLPESMLGLFDKCPTDLLEEGFDEDLLQSMDVGFDDQHMRITYPLRDLEGHLVGISGRTVTDEKPKYKVYDKEFKRWDLPEHATQKSHLLWNGHIVYPQVYLSEDPTFLIVVEGFKACMQIVQAGIPNVVAILGAYMSDLQARQIERMASRVYLMLDNNAAGLGGTVRAGMALGIPSMVVPYPDEREQPSDLCAEEIELALSCSRDFHRWLLGSSSAMKIYQDRRSRQRSFT